MRGETVARVVELAGLTAVGASRVSRKQLMIRVEEGTGRCTVWEVGLHRCPGIAHCALPPSLMHLAAVPTSCQQVLHASKAARRRCARRCHPHRQRPSASVSGGRHRCAGSRRGQRGTDQLHSHTGHIVAGWACQLSATGQSAEAQARPGARGAARARGGGPAARLGSSFTAGPRSPRHCKATARLAAICDAACTVCRGRGGRHGHRAVSSCP